jgi:hypothetical protein
MALAVPTHEKLGKIGFSAMNTLGLTRKQARRTCLWHTLLSFNPSSLMKPSNSPPPLLLSGSNKGPTNSNPLLLTI